MKSFEYNGNTVYVPNKCGNCENAAGCDKLAAYIVARMSVKNCKESGAQPEDADRDAQTAARTAMLMCCAKDPNGTQGVPDRWLERPEATG